MSCMRWLPVEKTEHSVSGRTSGGAAKRSKKKSRGIRSPRGASEGRAIVLFVLSPRAPPPPRRFLFFASSSSEDKSRRRERLRKGRAGQRSKERGQKEPARDGSRQALSRSLFDRRTRGGGGATIKKQLRSSKQERGGLAQLHSPAGARAGLGAEEAGEACLLVEGAGEERHGGDRWWF